MRQKCETNVSRAQHMKNSGFPGGKHYILQNRHFQEKLEKSLQKPPKILPKSTPNPSKISKKSINIDQKSDADLRCAKKAKQMRKSGPRAPQKMSNKVVPDPRIFPSCVQVASSCVRTSGQLTSDLRQVASAHWGCGGDTLGL